MEYPFNLLTDYFLRENIVDLSCDYEISTLPARELLCYNRFDLMAKWIYIDAKEKKLNMKWAIEIYRDNINAFSNGTFLEPGSEEKNSFGKYIAEFELLIEDIKTRGFDNTISLIPVGRDNVLLDGAHRVATAAYYDKKITIIKFPELDRMYDYDYFRRYLMNDLNMGYMAIYYTHIKRNCYMACVWPIAVGKSAENVKEILRGSGKIIYSQDIYLTYQGLQNFMIQIYRGQAWVGNIDNRFEGIIGKVSACYKKNYPVRTYLFEAINLEEVIKIKNRIRELFDFGNHSIHISDNQYETEEMAELLFNKSSLEFLNFESPYQYLNLYQKLMKVRNEIKVEGLDKGRFIVGPQAMLKMCGLYKSGDFNILSDYNQSVIGAMKADNVEFCEKSGICDMLYNPENYFYFEEMKFANILCMNRFKLAQKGMRKAEWIKQHRDFLKEIINIPKEYRFKTKTKIREYQLKYRMYGGGGLNLKEYKEYRYLKFWQKVKMPLKKIRKAIKV